MNCYFSYDSPVGEILIGANESAITRVTFTNTFVYDVRVETPLIKKAHRQLEEYFGGTRFEFDLPLEYHGTPFQESVWNSLRKIPYGETRSYQDVAYDIGNFRACRAVGNTNRINPIAIIIPCHRVIKQDGSLGGYWYHTDIKKFLLEHEEINKKRSSNDI